MEKILNQFKKISEWLNVLIKYISGLMLAIMAIVVTIQIIFRIFFNALSYTEELSRYLLVWSSLFAASVAYQQGSHIGVTFIKERFQGHWKNIITILIHFLCSLFFLVSIHYGFQLINMQVFQTSPALLIPMRYIYLGIPLSFSVMLFHSLIFLWEEMIILFKGAKQ